MAGNGAIAAVPSPPIFLAALAAGLFSAVIWGATPAATAFAVLGMEPLTAGLLRTVLAMPIVLIIAIMAKLPLPGTRREWALLLISSLCGFLGFTLIFTIGIAQTSTSHAGLILAGVPLLTGLAGALAARAMPSRLWFAGAAIAITGEVILITSRGGAVGEAPLSGDLLCVMSTLCAAIGYVAGSRVSERIGTWATTAWGITLAATIQIPILWFTTTEMNWAAVPAAAWGGVAYLVVMSAVVAYAAWYWSLSTGGVVRVSPVQYAQPLVSLILAVVLFSEPMTMPLIVAAVLILGGIALARRG